VSKEKYSSFKDRLVLPDNKKIMDKQKQKTMITKETNRKKTLKKVKIKTFLQNKNT
jgi:hypothetical protein